MYRRMARVALVLTIASTAMGYASLEKKVTVVIEGEPVAVRTFAPSIGDALERAGIDVAPRDRVTPGLDEPVIEGARIVIRRAKPLELVVDGRPRRVTVTALRVEGALKEAGIDELHPKDIIRPRLSSRVESGMTIKYRPVDLLEVRVGNRLLEIATNRPRVAGVLDELGVRVGPLDRVEPPLGELHDNGEIRVLRVDRRTESETVAVPYRTIVRKTKDLEYGERKVAREGRQGLRRIKYRITLVNGEPERREQIEDRLIRPAVDRLVLVGTSFPGCGCDRGIATGDASWYGEADGLTAAHRTLPFGTVVRVENLANGKTVTVRIADRGPFIDGRIIDLSDEAFRRLAPLGRGVVRVRIRW